VATIIDLRTEYLFNPIGIETTSPSLSWKLESSERNILQESFRIKCASSIEELENESHLLWDSGEVKSDKSIHTEYKGSTLVSAQKVHWQVKVRTNKGNESDWSEPAFWEMGLLEKSDWKAKWIEPNLDENPETSNPCPLLRKEFKIEKEISKARIYVTARGLYHLQLNGQKVGDQELTPGWTSYHKRLQYQVFDITDQLKAGNIAIGAILGDGWYRGFFGWQGKKNLYGEKTALLCQLKLTFSDGSEQLIISDKSWKAATGAILQSEIYHGEIYDARLEKIGWDNANYDDTNWKSVSEKDFGFDNLVASQGSPIRVTNEIKPIQKITTPKDETVLDFGQNMVGRIQFRLKGKRGDKITIYHAEVLDKTGNFYTDNLRSAKQKTEYTFKGEGIETYEPYFTFMGFRYIKIEDYTGEINLNDFTGKVIHSDMEFTGDFECSDSPVNQLHKNIQWGLRGNFVDVPTDCPQRDERMGWTGDAQVFAPTACFNVNAAPFFTKWMKDVAADQREDGNVPWVVPMVIENGGGTGWSDGYGGTGWADAAIIIPWTIYERFGDKRILAEQYNSMKGWEEYMINEAGEKYLFNTGFHFGDWLSFAEYSSYIYNAPDYGFAGAHTEKDLIATAYFYHSTHLMAQIAQVLGKTDDAEKYASLLPRIKKAFRDEFITQNGRLISNTQTAYSLALSFALIPDEFLETAAEKLAENVNHFQHLTTGFLGTPVLCHALTNFGFPELAFKLLFNIKYPSWLYAVTMGATTIWERWDGIKPDGTFQDVGMNSFNHYAYGAIGNWLYEKVAGIQPNPENPGYKNIIVKPVISDKLKFAGASYKSMYGEIKSRWELEAKNVQLSVTIPANTMARIFIPANENSVITENGKLIESLENISIIGHQNGYFVVETGSGSYVFMSKLK
jgi:alpha-L-rhamnosidase